MQDFEKLGIFYLGRRVRPCHAHRLDDTGSLRLARSGDARGLRRDDRQRQDRPLPLPDRRSRDRRRPGDCHRPERGSRKPAADLPGLGPQISGRGSIEDEARRAGRDAGRLTPRSRPSRMERRPGRMGPGRRPHRAPAALRRLCDLHAGQPGGHAGFDPQFLRGAARGQCATMRSCWRNARQDRDEPPVARRGRRRRHAAASTRCVATLLTTAWKAGPRSGPRRTYPAGADAAVSEGRRGRSRVVLPGRRIDSTWRCS